jgi:hypothetical protein
LQPPTCAPVSELNSTFQTSTDICCLLLCAVCRPVLPASGCPSTALIPTIHATHCCWSCSRHGRPLHTVGRLLAQLASSGTVTVGQLCKCCHIDPVLRRAPHAQHRMNNPPDIGSALVDAPTPSLPLAQLPLMTHERYQRRCFIKLEGCADCGGPVLLWCRLDLPNGLSLGVDRIADRRVALIKQRWTAGPYRSSSTAAAAHDQLHRTPC